MFWLKRTLNSLSLPIVVHTNGQSQPLDVSGIMSAIVWSMGGADSVSVEKWSLSKKDMGFQGTPLSECRCCLESIANAECYGSSE